MDYAKIKRSTRIAVNAVKKHTRRLRWGQRGIMLNHRLTGGSGTKPGSYSQLGKAYVLSNRAEAVLAGY